ncbi:hypothetical protein MP638_000482 [Amoeboaphelidium occidentale]|nr:hypothetical protein MP638_000482 [Amoeboaphelidium occidentale]
MKKSLNSKRKWKNLKQILSQEEKHRQSTTKEDIPTCNFLFLVDSFLKDSSIAAHPPLLNPKKKYCDLTGLQCCYKDPKSLLFFHSKYEYRIISRELSPSAIREYLELRRGIIQLK